MNCRRLSFLDILRSLTCEFSSQSALLRKEQLIIYLLINFCVIHSAVYFGTYEYMRELLHPGCRTNGEESLSTMLVSGGLAGSLSWLCCYPLDVVKSRLQAQCAGGAPPQYKGIIDCIRTSASQEGNGVFWRGLGPSLARAFLVNGAIFSAYELSLRYLTPRSPKDDLGFQPMS